MILVSAVRLLRRFPALCVPALLAAVLQYKVVLLRPKIVYWMVAHWPRQHSVLVSEGNVGSRAFGNGFLYTEVSLGILMQVVQFAVWCAAFVLTGACLRQRPFGITVSWRRAGLWLQPHLGTVLLFSVAVYVVVVSTSALLGMMYTPASHVHGLGLLLWVATGLGVLVLCGASVFTLRLLPGGDRTVASDRWTTAGYKLLALCLSSGEYTRCTPPAR